MNRKERQMQINKEELIDKLHALEPFNADVPGWVWDVINGAGDKMTTEKALEGVYMQGYMDARNDEGIRPHAIAEYYLGLIE